MLFMRFHFQIFITHSTDLVTKTLRLRLDKRRGALTCFFKTETVKRPVASTVAHCDATLNYCKTIRISDIFKNYYDQNMKENIL